MSSVESMVDSPASREMIEKLGGGGSLVDSFLATEFAFIGLFTSAYVVSTLLRMSSEEAAGRAEVVLATRTARRQWLASHGLIALGGAAAMVAASGVAVSVSRGLASSDLGGAFGSLLPAALVQVPAVWVIGGVAILLYGLSPRLAVGAWAVLVLCLMLGQLGPLLGLPDSALNLSPFTHSPHLPEGALSATPLVVLTLVAAALLTAGALRFRRRDLG